MQLIQFFRIQFTSVIELLSNAIWLLSAEFVAKISRIFTIVVLAAQLSPTSYGTAMLALAFHDVFGLLLRAGVGSQLINCKLHQLENFAKNGIIIQWAICLTIIIGQWSSADYFSSLYDNDDIAVLLKIMAVIYLLYPWVSIKIFLLQRENKMRWFSIRNGLCVIIENCTIAITALLGADIFSVALGKIAFSIFWLLLFSFSPVKSYGVGFKFSIINQMYFNESLRQSEDIELWTRIALTTKWQFAGIKTSLTFYRVNDPGLSADVDKQFASWQHAVMLNKASDPNFFKEFYSLAKAYQLRYLARRAVQSESKIAAFKLIHQAIYCNYRIIYQEPKRTIMTLCCAWLKFLPSKFYNCIEKFAMLNFGNSSIKS
jgi:hypothetical protein